MSWWVENWRAGTRQTWTRKRDHVLMVEHILLTKEDHIAACAPIQYLAARDHFWLRIAMFRKLHLWYFVHRTLPRRCLLIDNVFNALFCKLNAIQESFLAALCLRSRLRWVHAGSLLGLLCSGICDCGAHLFVMMVGRDSHWLWVLCFGTWLNAHLIRTILNINARRRLIHIMQIFPRLRTDQFQLVTDRCM